MSDISGAEHVLLDVAAAWPDASAFLFQPGVLAERLSGLGLSVEVARNPADLGAIRRDQSAFRATSKIWPIIGLIRQLSRAARKADAVYANSQKAFTLSAIACLIARRPLIWHLHDILDSAHFGRMQRELQIFLANHLARRVIVPSMAAAEAFRAAGGHADLINVVANGRDLAPIHTDRLQLREQLGLPQGPLIGVFSRLAAWKGQDVFLRALAKLPDVNGVIAGSAMFGETGFESKLRSMVVDLGLSDRVRFLGRRDDVARLMQAVDVVVHPSIDPEPFGLTLVEAMLVGTPVIASAAGASGEILQNGRYGRLFMPGSDDDLVNGVRSMLAAPDHEMISAASDHARARYSVRRMRADIATVVLVCLGKVAR